MHPPHHVSQRCMMRDDDAGRASITLTVSPNPATPTVCLSPCDGFDDNYSSHFDVTGTLTMFSFIGCTWRPGPHRLHQFERGCSYALDGWTDRACTSTCAR